MNEVHTQEPFGKGDRRFAAGHTLVRDQDYQNVSIKIYGRLSAGEGRATDSVEDVVATLD